MDAQEKYIISADRDEHIRVSWYPQGYSIESYCLGSLTCVPSPISGIDVYLVSIRFVSTLLVSNSSPNLLVSGGGEEFLRVWDWKSGRQTAQLPFTFPQSKTWQDYVSFYPTVKERKKSPAKKSESAVPEGERVEVEQEQEEDPEQEEKKKALVVDSLHSFTADDSEMIAFSFVGYVFSLFTSSAKPHARFCPGGQRFSQHH
jgi:tRNA (guanine-N(7)-)-methyltransferase subunit TRM82